MASLTPSILPKDPHTQIIIVGATLVLLIGVIFAVTFQKSKKEDEENPSGFNSFLRFFYASFLKPHTGDGLGEGQQAALESFYKAQAGVYDATRKRLLRGREDMLGLVAAQLVQKAAEERSHDPKRIWVDVSIYCRSVESGNLTVLCLADRWWHRLEYRSHVRIYRCPRILLQRLLSRLLSLPLRGGPKAIQASWLEECEGCVPGREDLPPRGLRT
jgi:hypothetical protein